MKLLKQKFGIVSSIETEVAVGIYFNDLNEVTSDDSIPIRRFWRMPCQIYAPRINCFATEIQWRRRWNCMNS
jgi:hypothetical protein